MNPFADVDAAGRPRDALAMHVERANKELEQLEGGSDELAELREQNRHLRDTNSMLSSLVTHEHRLCGVEHNLAQHFMVYNQAMNSINITYAAVLQRIETLEKVNAERGTIKSPFSTTRNQVVPFPEGEKKSEPEPPKEAS